MLFFFFFFLNLVTCSTAIQLSKSKHVVQEESCGLLEQTGYIFSDGRDGILSRAEVKAGLVDMSDSQVADFLKALDPNEKGEITEEDLYAQMLDFSEPEATRRANARNFVLANDLSDDSIGATRDVESCSNGFVSNSDSDSSVECQSDGTWSLASGCILDSIFGTSFIEVGSTGGVECGQPSFEGYLFWRNNDNKLDRSELAEYDDEAFSVLDGDDDGFVSIAELAKQPTVDVDAFLETYDKDFTVPGSIKLGECSGDYSGEPDPIMCLAQGTWSAPSGCSLADGKGATGNPIDAFSGIQKSDTNTSLSTHSLGQIAEWISKEFSKSSASFCWRHSYDRGVGTPLHCGGLVQVGMQCYNHCSRGNGVGGSCCYYHHISCRWHGWSLRCSGGYLECWGRGGGHWANSCDSGRRNEGGLCYRNPNSGYNCGATVCHKECDYRLGIVGCGFAACASDDAACGQAIAGMVIAPMVMAMNFFTFGSGKGLSTTAKAIKEGVGAINDCVNAAGLLHATANTFVRALNDFIKLAKKDLAAITPEHTHSSLKSICGVSSLSSGSNNNNACVEQIAELWGYKLAYSVASAARQADLMAQMEFVDPTGILGVVNAYNKPNCEDATPNYTGPRW